MPRYAHNLVKSPPITKQVRQYSLSDFVARFYVYLQFLAVETDTVIEPLAYHMLPILVWEQILWLDSKFLLNPQGLLNNQLCFFREIYDSVGVFLYLTLCNLVNRLIFHQNAIFQPNWSVTTFHAVNCDTAALIVYIRLSDTTQFAYTQP